MVLRYKTSIFSDSKVKSNIFKYQYFRETRILKLIINSIFVLLLKTFINFVPWSFDSYQGIIQLYH